MQDSAEQALADIYRAIIFDERVLDVVLDYGTSAHSAQGAELDRLSVARTVLGSARMLVDALVDTVVIEDLERERFDAEITGHEILAQDRTADTRRHLRTFAALEARSVVLRRPDGCLDPVIIEALDDHLRIYVHLISTHPIEHQDLDEALRTVAQQPLYPPLAG